MLKNLVQALSHTKDSVFDRLKDSVKSGGLGDVTKVFSSR